MDSYKGDYQVIEFHDCYAHEDDEYYNYKKGGYMNEVAILKLVFTSTMKLRLAIEIWTYNY